jgi:GNAT superfamily N-acetyltransferase
MDIQFRAARPEDLPGCMEAFLEAVTDLRLRQNMPPLPGTPLERRLAYYHHVLDTGAWTVAEADGRVAGFACAIVRDALWFLAGFWVRPAMQSQHIGMRMLRMTWEAGKQMGAKTFFVWASSDLPALSAYMRIGMLPGCEILEFEGAAKTQPLPSGYSAQELERSFALELDGAVMSTRREVDHAFYSENEWQPRQVQFNGAPVGYFYFREGRIGPAAWTEPRHATAVLAHACRETAAAGFEATLMVPGMNHEALRFAFGSGLKLTGFSHLLTTAQFGKLEQYCPAGPMLF